MADGRSRVACVVVTHDALPWVEQCLRSVAGTETVVVDNGSTDGTADFVRERFPSVRVVADENRGLAAGWNRGIAETDSDHVLVLNADAWLVEDALTRLLAVAHAHPRAAVIGPRLLNPDGTLQRSVRGYPTLWRLATEYLYLRKLAPGSRAFNSFYGAGFDHASERQVEWVMGACMLVRRAAYDEVGPFDESYFLFSEEVDWMRRAADRGWSVVFTPVARCVHVGGAAHAGRMFRENVRGHLRYLSLHGRPGEAERARKLLHASLVVRGRLHRGERARLYREVAAWLGSGDVEALLAG
ncbi:MAG TPA: glycosyltransferase family 2 protein [Gaiella sp.]|uniref:glycosyltransferase family 2 protein n=1 Tax=Gaiella sp. TaxID=2663207 RepID=UPI002D808BB1|nr:glycosyltransferase family 2 protein [Gaiella sp.]HET9288581.1 glycosyltransferase family 2 protein [Gaiella sp.]